jgi:aspartate/methionine/tyrosine aminotransferase
VLAAIDADTIAVVINTPHNPTGSVMARTEIERLARHLKPRGILLIVDEVYHPLYFGQAPPSAAGINGVVVISDLSKAFSLPGLRTGWIVDLDATRRSRIIDARSYFTISGSPMTEVLAAHALRERNEILSRLEMVAATNLARLDDMIALTKGVLSWVRPSGGTTCFPSFTDGRDSRRFCQELADNGVLVAPGDCFGHPAHLRIGFAQQAVDFDVALGTILKLLSNAAPN